MNVISRDRIVLCLYYTANNLPLWGVILCGRNWSRPLFCNRRIPEICISFDTGKFLSLIFLCYLTRLRSAHQRLTNTIPESYIHLWTCAIITRSIALPVTKAVSWKLWSWRTGILTGGATHGDLPLALTWRYHEHLKAQHTRSDLTPPAATQWAQSRRKYDIQASKWVELCTISRTAYCCRLPRVSWRRDLQLTLLLASYSVIIGG